MNTTSSTSSVALATLRRRSVLFVATKYPKRSPRIPTPYASSFTPMLPSREKVSAPFSTRIVTNVWRTTADANTSVETSSDRTSARVTAVTCCTANTTARRAAVDTTSPFQRGHFSHLTIPIITPARSSANGFSPQPLVTECALWV